MHDCILIFHYLKLFSSLKPLSRSYSEGSNKTPTGYSNDLLQPPIIVSSYSSTSNTSFTDELSTPLNPLEVPKKKAKHSRSKSLNDLNPPKTVAPLRDFASSTFGIYLHSSSVAFPFEEFVNFVLNLGSLSMENAALADNLCKFFTTKTSCDFVKSIFAGLHGRIYNLHQDSYQIPVDNNFSRHDVSAVLRRTRSSTNHYITEKFNCVWKEFKRNWNDLIPIGVLTLDHSNILAKLFFDFSTLLTEKFITQSWGKRLEDHLKTPMESPFTGLRSIDKAMLYYVAGSMLLRAQDDHKGVEI